MWRHATSSLIACAQNLKRCSPPKSNKYYMRMTSKKGTQSMSTRIYEEERCYRLSKPKTKLTRANKAVEVTPPKANPRVSNEKKDKFQQID